MPTESWVLLLWWAFVAEVIGTMAGFGAATILTPIAALFLDVKTAIALVSCFHLFGNSARLWFFGRSIDWAIWKRFGLTGVACSLLGAGLTTQLSSTVVKRLFGLFLVSYVILSRVAASMRPSGVRLPKTTATLIGGGIVSGLIAGFIGTGGAIRSACLLAFDLPKEAYLGTSAAIALLVDATRLPVYVAGGFIPARMGPVIAGLVLVAFAGSWVGQRLVRRVSAGAFRGFVMVVLFLMGLKMLMAD